MATKYSVAQLTKFAKAVKIPMTTARLDELYASKHLTTPVSFFELIVPELKELGWGGAEALKLVNGTNKVRKQFVDVVLCALIDDLKPAVAQKLAAHVDSVDDLAALKAAELVEVGGGSPADGKRLAGAFKKAAEVLSGLDAEMQLKVR